MLPSTAIAQPAAQSGATSGGFGRFFGDLAQTALQTGADFGRSLLELELFEERSEAEAAAFFREQERLAEAGKRNGTPDPGPSLPPWVIPAALVAVTAIAIFARPK